MPRSRYAAPVSSIEVRVANADDYDFFAKTFPELATGEDPASRERFEGEMMGTMLIAEREGKRVGYLYFQLLAGCGYLRQIATAPSVRRSGVGRALMDVCARALVKAGANEWCLNVEPGNTAACAFYEQFGLSPRYRSSALRIAWSTVDQLVGEEGVLGRLVSQADDDVVEKSFGLLPGTLRDARARPGRIITAVHEPSGEAVGIAVFDPAFPGAFPFRVRRPALAANLLGALQMFRGEHIEIHLVIEDDEPLATMLLDAGAILKFHITHYAGPLPS
jgi:ribosomal protein S18 acetylase RimI-like enzyme